MKTVKITLEVPQEEADKLIEKYQTKKPWRAEQYGEYWCVDSHGYLLQCHECKTPVSDYRYQVGNYFQNEAEAEHYKQLQEAEGRIRLRAIELGGGVGVDWEDESQMKCCPYYSHSGTGVIVDDSIYSVQCLPCSYLYFIDRSACKQLIKDCKEDLEFVFKNK